ncbi:TPA: TraR/DksA family transcriptional regulator [Neisseria cinerea]|uniref:TraR/DksA family transcriptional regulator n=1 Tax=Neisseria uirgultaei TaxID=2830646 RepID=UPI00265B6AB5|nr:TraR/DksA family transcriptional regulator [Neisseria uirgultaei]
MTDFADRASEREAEFLAEALAKHQPPSETTASLSHCEDCGSPIPEARQKAVQGCTRCIGCQEYFEHGFPR